MLTKAEALEIIQKLKNCINHDACEKTDCAYFHNIEDLNKLTEYVENAFPIVNCIDCKWCKNSNGNGRTCTFKHLDIPVFDVFFCFGGERNG